MCACVCVRACVSAFTCVCVYVGVFMCECVCAFLCMFVCVLVCMFVCERERTHTHARVFACSIYIHALG